MRILTPAHGSPVPNGAGSAAAVTNGRITPAPERLTLAIGYPVTIALQYSTGKKYPSTQPGAPDKMMYTLTDGRRAWLPLEVGRMIDALNLESREPFTLCKYGTDHWEVNRIIEKKADPIRKIESAQAGYKSNGQTTNHTPDALQTAAPPPAPPVNGPVNGLGESSAAIMARCYRTAIDVALGAVEYGKERGLMLAPCFEDVRALAATICISETGGRK